MHCCAIIHQYDNDHNDIDDLSKRDDVENKAIDGLNINYNKSKNVNNKNTHTHCWGRCRNNECNIPFIVEDIAMTVSAADTHTCILDQNSIITCTGDNNSNQLNSPIIQGYQFV